MVAKLSGTTGLEVPVPVAQTQGGTGEVASNIIVQSVRTDDGAVATGTTILPYDDSIPQNTEGDEYITVTITPKNALNKLVIESRINVQNSSAGFLLVALFKDSTVAALTASNIYENFAGAHDIGISHEIVAGSIAPITFKIRAGSAVAGTTTFNGTGGARRLGGVINSYIKVTEVTL